MDLDKWKTPARTRKHVPVASLDKQAQYSADTLLASGFFIFLLFLSSFYFPTREKETKNPTPAQFCLIRCYDTHQRCNYSTRYSFQILPHDTQ